MAALPVSTPFEASDYGILADLCERFENRVELLELDPDDYRDYQANWWSLEPFATYAAEEFPPAEPEADALWFFAGWAKVPSIPRVEPPAVAPPANPDNDRPYLVDAQASGDWEGHDGQMAIWKNFADEWTFSGIADVLPVVYVSNDYDYYRWIDDEWVAFRMDRELDVSRRLLNQYDGSRWEPYSDPAQVASGGQGNVFKVGDVLWSVGGSGDTPRRTNNPCYPISLWRTVDIDIVKSVYQMQRQCEWLMRYFEKSGGPEVWDPDSLWRSIGLTQGAFSRHVWFKFRFPPSSPPDDFVVIVADFATGAWEGHDREIASWNGDDWDFDDTTEWAYLYYPDNDDTPEWWHKVLDPNAPPGTTADWVEVFGPHECGWTRRRWRTLETLADDGDNGDRGAYRDATETLQRLTFYDRVAGEWVRSADQQSPPDVETFYGSVLPGDLATPNLVNEIWAALGKLTDPA